MEALIIKHIRTEGPGTIGDYLKDNGISFRLIELWRGIRLPDDLREISAVISLGGPMNVYEEKEYPFLAEENRFIKQLIEQEVPFLGVCLGAQLLAKAAGAKVYKAPVREIGWFKVRLTPEGEKDPFFDDVGDELDVFQWHGDTFDVPKGAKLLAKGDQVPNQVIKVGERAYGVQFHLEVDETVLKKWFSDPKIRKRYLDYLKKIKTSYDIAAGRILDNFLELTRTR